MVKVKWQNRYLYLSKWILIKFIMKKKGNGVLPEPASPRSRKRKSPLKDGLRNASSDRRPRPLGSEMGRQVDLWQKQSQSQSVGSGGDFSNRPLEALMRTWAVGRVSQRDKAGPTGCEEAPLQSPLSPERAADPQSRRPGPGCPTPAAANVFDNWVF